MIAVDPLNESYSHLRVLKCRLKGIQMNTNWRWLDRLCPYWDSITGANIDAGLKLKDKFDQSQWTCDSFDHKKYVNIGYFNLREIQKHCTIFIESNLTLIRKVLETNLYICISNCNAKYFGDQLKYSILREIRTWNQFLNIIRCIL